MPQAEDLIDDISRPWQSYRRSFEADIAVREIRFIPRMA